jgi:ABC-type branched-subunit amino acid transport system substrate-binding protein
MASAWQHRLGMRGRGVLRLCFFAVMACLLAAAPALVRAAEPTAPAAPAGEGQSVKVGIFLSSDADRCYTPGLVHAIRYFTDKLSEQVNAKGGIGGRQIALSFFEDLEQTDTTIANVKSAIEDPAMLAMIGISSSTRGAAVFAALGPEIRKQAIPFITEISLDSLFHDDPNVFTMASSVRNELEVVRKVIADAGAQRPVFVGLDDDLYARALGEGLEKDAGGVALTASLRAPVHNYELDDAAAQSIADQLKSKDPDMVLLAINSGPSTTLMQKLIANGISAPVFVLLGRIQSIVNGLGEKAYAGPMSQIARESVPNVYSERLRQRIWRSPQDAWVFNDSPNDDAPGWKSGACGDSVSPLRQTFDAANTRAIGRGTQYRDMLQLIAEAAHSAPKGASVPDLRRLVGESLRDFVEGRRVLKGLWQDWAFTSDRTAAGDTLILRKAPGDEATVLAPVQYRRINGALQKSTTVYTSIDLISLSRIDTNDRSFDAEFYLSMRSADNSIGIENVEFTNAYRSQAGEGRLLITRQIHNGVADSNFPANVKLYKVSGKFEFEPDLGDYPFDTQRLSVSFQPADAARPFLIQPAPQSDETEAAVDGWELKEHYVGSDQDIIPTLGTSLSEKRVVPFYKFNTTWIVRRLAVDYYLRVVVPLAFILLVTYFSVFLPHARFDSVMAIQVTALLSSIALYLALPKLDSDQATLSDKIFMMTYAAVSSMIGLSILKDNLRDSRLKPLLWLVDFVQWIVFPVATIAFIMYLLPSTKGGAMHLAGTLSGLWKSIFG